MPGYPDPPLPTMPADSQALYRAKEWAERYLVEIRGGNGLWSCRVTTPDYEMMDGRAGRDKPTFSIVSPTCTSPQEAIAAVMQILRG